MNKSPFEIHSVTNTEQETISRQALLFFKLWKNLLILAFVFALAALGWLIFGQRDSFSDRLVTLSLEAPSQISSGDLVSYKVKYGNDNVQNLEGVKIFFSYPKESLAVKNGQTQSLAREEVDLGRLEKGGSGELEFQARLMGQRGEIKKAVVRMVYAPVNLRSTFEKETEALTNISSLALSLTLSALPQAVSGQAVTYLLDYRSESQENLENWRLVFAYPDGFTFQRSNPAPVQGKEIWQIKQIKPGEGQRISIEGILQGEEGENKPLAVEAQKELDGHWVSYQRVSSFTTLTRPPLTVEVAVNQQSDYVAKLGDSLRYDIKFTNFSEVDLAGLTLRVRLEGSMFDLDNLQSSGFFDRSSQTVIFNAASSPLLNNLAPSQYGVVTLAVPLKSQFPSNGLGAKDLVVKAEVYLESLTVPPDFQFERLTAQKVLIIKIKSLPVFQQKASYQDSQWGSSGPWPPQVGKKTVYTLNWQLINTASDALNTQIKAVLPQGVEWENEARVSHSQPPPVYRTASREVVWEIGTLPAGVGSLMPRYEAWFRVSVTPLAQQAGDKLVLLNHSLLEGEDGLTRQAFVISASDLTSNDLIDFPGQGEVVE